MRRKKSDKADPRSAEQPEAITPTPEGIVERLVFDPLDAALHYLEVHHGQVGLDQSLVYRILKGECGLRRAEVRELTVPQLGALFGLLHRLESAADEPGRRAVLVEARDLRGRLAGADGPGLPEFRKALDSWRFPDPDGSARVPETPKVTTGGLTPLARKLLRAYRDLEAWSSEEPTTQGQVVAAAAGKVGHVNSPKVRDAFDLLEALRFVETKRGVGTWLTRGGLAARKRGDF
jgi:hypothetical protein